MVDLEPSNVFIINVLFLDHRPKPSGSDDDGDDEIWLHRVTPHSAMGQESAGIQENQHARPDDVVESMLHGSQCTEISLQVRF